MAIRYSHEVSSRDWALDQVRGAFLAATTVRFAVRTGTLGRSEAGGVAGCDIDLGFDLKV